MIPNLPTGNSAEHVEGDTISTAPDAYVQFFPWEVKDPKKAAYDSFVVTAKEEIISIQTSKSKQGQGNFSIVLAPKRPYHSILTPGCWVTIYMSDQELKPDGGSKKNSGLKMVGIVRSVRKVQSNDPGTGIRSIRYVISGDDFAAALNIPLMINAGLAGLETGNSSLHFLTKLFPAAQGHPELSVRTPDTLIEEFLYLVYTGKGKKNPGLTKEQESSSNPTDQEIKATLGHTFTIPSALIKQLYGVATGGTGFLGLMDRSFQRNLPGKQAIRPEIGGTVTLYSLIKTFSNPVSNEAITDIYPLADASKDRMMPMLIFRAIPFSKKDQAPHSSCRSIVGAYKNKTPNVLKNYVSKSIVESEILQLNYGKNDAERFNFFLVVPSHSSHKNWDANQKLRTMIANAGGLDNLSNPTSVARYGLRPFTSTSVFLVDDKNFTVFNDIAKDMWEDAWKFDNGLVTIAGPMEHIPVGTVIEFKERGWIAHVEAVSYHYQVEPSTGRKSYAAEIAFVRLSDLNGKPLFFEEEEQEYDPGSTYSSMYDEKGEKIAMLNIPNPLKGGGILS